MISSVVAQFDSYEVLTSICERLAGWPGVEVGTPVQGCSLPLTLEAESPEALEDMHRWLRDLPGVQFIDVVCIFF